MADIDFKVVSGSRINSEHDAASASVEGMYVNDVKVVGSQGVNIADPSGGATVDTEARAQLILLLTALETHGLLASS